MSSAAQARAAAQENTIDAELRQERNRRRRRRQAERRTAVEPIAGRPRRHGPLLTFARIVDGRLSIGRAPASTRTRMESAGFHPVPKRRWRKVERRRAV